MFECVDRLQFCCQPTRTSNVHHYQSTSWDALFGARKWLFLLMIDSCWAICSSIFKYSCHWISSRRNLMDCHLIHFDETDKMFYPFCLLDHRFITQLSCRINTNEYGKSNLIFNNYYPNYVESNRIIPMLTMIYPFIQL